MVGPATAEGYCVACFSPDAVYRCIVAGRPESAPPDPAAQIRCIKELAAEGKHARCSVERFSAAGCNGPEKIITAAPLASPPPAPANTTPASGPNSKAAQPAPSDAGADPAAAPDEPGDKPPRTVEELAKSTADKTKKSLESVGDTVKKSTETAGDQIEGAGSAIGNAAKKTWNCLSSFFDDC